jgi:hypothetical protein
MVHNMKKLILLLFLFFQNANGAYIPQTVISDATTATTASVNASHELDIFLSSDSNVCKETGGNLASILSTLEGTLSCSVTNFPGTQPISGSVSVSNFPATQPISGSVSVSNFPSTYPVTGTFWQTTQPISASSLPLPTGAATAANQSTIIGALGSPFQAGGSIGNTTFGVTQTTSPWITSISNFPASTIVTQSTGSDLHVDVDNFPATQPVSGTIAVSNFPGTQPISGSVSISNFPSTYPVTGTFWQTTQPVSVASLPLPSGASTSALQSSIITALGSPFQAGGSIGNTSFVVTQSTGSNLHANIDNFPATQPISAASLPLPTGASTSALQSSLITALGSPFQSGGSIGNTSFIATQTTGSNLHANIDNFPATQPVSGNVNASQSGTWNITNISGVVSLPTGAATAANQTNGSEKSQLVDGSGSVVGPVQTISGTNYLPVVLASSGTIGTTVPIRTIQVGGSDGTNLRTLSTDTTGNLNVNIVSSAVVSGRTSVTNTVTNYTSTNVTTSAYVTLISSTANTINQENIFDSSGQTLYLSYAASCGALATGTNTIIIVPGGSGLISWQIPSGNCVGVQAQSGTANTGILAITYLK